MSDQNTPPQNNPANNQPSDPAKKTDPLLQKVANLKEQKELEKQKLKIAIEGEEISKMKEDLRHAKEDLVKAKNTVEELTSIAKRALADLENYRRRAETEKASFVQFANASLILEILPILDNFKRAFEHIPESLKNNDWVKGIIAIEKQLVDLLQKCGLTEIEALGKPFDPNFHEAMLSGPGEKDIIIEILEKGYLLEDKVLKPAKVKIGNGEISA